MMQVKAKYANGVLTPLEPLDLNDGDVVVLNIETASKPEQEAAKSKFQVVPLHSEFVIGVDPKKLKQFLNDEDDERYLKSLNRTE
jgi:predicted DNA-binding antitoxin AbrB/MazE fold protein